MVKRNMLLFNSIQAPLSVHARKVPFDRPNNPTLEPGLSLGRLPRKKPPSGR